MCPQAALHDCRTVTRHFHEGALQRMNARVKADPSLMRQRRCAAEHPFGTIKRMTAGGRLLAADRGYAGGPAVTTKIEALFSFRALLVPEVRFEPQRGQSLRATLAPFRHHSQHPV